MGEREAVRAYYNEIDPYTAEWLRNLIALGQLPSGDVDERDIRDVAPDDLAGYGQCHFFAGIGGWPLALKLAGWPEDAEVWTGSCPCQPFSVAGAHRGADDERHLWPAFHRLIAERKPAMVSGEQVASKDGRGWLAGVRADLEALGYAVGAADLCAAGVGAPHIRQRLWWVANTMSARRAERGTITGKRSIAGDGGDRGMGDANSARHALGIRIIGDDETTFGAERGQTTQQTGHWSIFDLIPCADGKARRIEPGTFPLAHGVLNRVGRLRAYGNAIVPQVAAEFIAAFMECRA